MKLNYSTAKTILFLYRRKLKSSSRPDHDRTSSSEISGRSETASYRVGQQKLEISSSIGGNPTYGAIRFCGVREWTPLDRPIQVSL
jgi:hypothetical protein